jgi:hypothetical protein
MKYGRLRPRLIDQGTFETILEMILFNFYGKKVTYYHDNKMKWCHVQYFIYSIYIHR